MAKRKSAIRRVVRRVVRRSSSKKGFGVGGIVEAAKSGAILALGMKGVSMLGGIVGFSGAFLKWLGLGIMYFLGGVFRKAAMIGVAMEVYGFASGMLSGLNLGTQTIAEGGF